MQDDRFIPAIAPSRHILSLILGPSPILSSRACARSIYAVNSSLTEALIRVICNWFHQALRFAAFAFRLINFHPTHHPKRKVIFGYGACFSTLEGMPSACPGQSERVIDYAARGTELGLARAKPSNPLRSAGLLHHHDIGKIPELRGSNRY